MKSKVFISTVGTGSRLGGLTRYINKSLLSVGTKPVLTHILEKFPKDSEFIIATGYKAELVEEYLSLAHSDLNIKIIRVENYEGEGSGLGHTFSCVEDELQCPFYFCSCDTLCSCGTLADIDTDWIVLKYSPSDDPRYRTVRLLNEVRIAGEGIEKIQEKGEYGHSYVGLCHVQDYERFWEGMHAASSPELGEVEGLRNLDLSKMKYTFANQWDDTGCLEGLEAARVRYRKESDPNILPKEDEAIWILDDKVIKFFNNSTLIEQRVQRAEQLKGFVPEIIGVRKHMYSYRKAEGTVLSDCINVPIFNKLLNTLPDFWKLPENIKLSAKDFHIDCGEFYKTKTYERVQKFYKRFSKVDKEYTINGKEYPKLQEILDSVNWSSVCRGVPVRFHGDLHNENILYSEDKGFTFLDWRQSFGKSLEIGDVYYDLAKLYHGLIVNHGLIHDGHFSVYWQGNNITYDFYRRHVLVECEQALFRWIEKSCYDGNKVKLMTALIFLNICGLHESPYSFMLYALGTEMLYSSTYEK